MPSAGAVALTRPSFIGVGSGVTGASPRGERNQRSGLANLARASPRSRVEPGPMTDPPVTVPPTSVGCHYSGSG